MQSVSARQVYICLRGVASFVLAAIAIECNADESEARVVQAPAEHSIIEEVRAAHLAPDTPPLAPQASIAPMSDLLQKTMPSIEEAFTPEDATVTAAVADGVTTIVALSSGAVEVNPLVFASPVGVVAATGMKYGLVKYAETLPEQEKRTTLKTATALWGGAAVNNLFVLLAAPPPLAVIAGVVGGIMAWNHMGSRYQQEDELIAAHSALETSNQATLVSTSMQKEDSSGN